MADIEALIQRAAVTGDGYAMAVRLATRVPVTSWGAEVVFTGGASAQAGPGSIWDGRVLFPTQGALTPRKGSTAHGAAWLGVTGTTRAPASVRIRATTPDGTVHDVTVAKVVVTDPRTKATKTATESDWPGSTRLAGQGSGGGGGGGGGGQFTCDLHVDIQAGVVRHRITSDAGGGGGAGGGSGSGYSNDYQGKQGNQ